MILYLYNIMMYMAFDFLEEELSILHLVLHSIAILPERKIYFTTIFAKISSSNPFFNYLFLKFMHCFCQNMRVKKGKPFGNRNY